MYSTLWQGTKQERNVCIENETGVTFSITIFVSSRWGKIDIQQKWWDKKSKVIKKLGVFHKSIQVTDERLYNVIL